jgi:DNA-binding beta-propeller fold protein YncE
MTDTSLRSSPGVCVAAVLGDALRRAAVLGGREGMPRSLGSVYGGSVTRFLGGSCRGVVSRVIATPGVTSWGNGIAVSRDGCTLVVSDADSNAVHEIDAVDASVRRVAGGRAVQERPPFSVPYQVCITPDSFVFVADSSNARVQVLTLTLDFHAFVGVGQLVRPCGVCANVDVVVVSENTAHRISVFSRRDDAAPRRFGSQGRLDGELLRPCGLCFVAHDRHVAVADSGNNRVSVFSIDGEFIRHVGVGALLSPQGVAASAFDELVVADAGNGRVVVFSDAGDLLATLGEGYFTGVALCGSTLFAVDNAAHAVSVLV